jgi:flagellar hook-associated protein 2
MAITSAGIGSGLDVASLVTQLVAAERAPSENRLDRAESKAKTTLSAIGVFKSAMAGFQSAVSALTGSASGLGKFSATVSKPELFSASATSSASPGSYDVEVIQLARAHKIATSAYASADAVVGSGTVTIGVGSASFAVTLQDGANTLADLRDRINQASDNKGVTATLVNDAGGTRLLLTSREAGTAKSLAVSSALSAGGASFVTTQNVQTALDAEFEIDGFSFTRSSNTISDAVDGVTFTLLKQEPGTMAGLNVTGDSAASTAAVENFVKAWNALSATVSTYSRYDASTQTGGPLMGQSNVRGAMQQLRSVLGGSAGGGQYDLLVELGISTQADGTLKLDSGKLSAALNADREGVKALFGGSGGIATKLSDVLDGYLESNGRIDAQTQNLQSRLDDISDQRDALDLRMAAVERRYRTQFTALDTLLGQLQTTSSYLTQQLANLPGANSGS